MIAVEMQQFMELFLNRQFFSAFRTVDIPESFLFHNVDPILSV